MLERHLDDAEVHAKQVEATIALTYDGAIDDEVLGEALRLTSRLHPVLRARIEARDDGDVLHFSDERCPELTVERLDGEALEDELRAPMDHGAGVARIFVTHDGTAGRLVFQTNHAVCDGRSVTTILQDLWDLYGSLLDGRAVGARPGTSLPVSPQELIKRRWGRLTWNDLRPDLMLQVPDTPAPAPTVPIQRLVRLGGPETSALRHAARQAGISVHALICGAILLALRRQGPVAEPAHMACFSVVNMLSRVSPPVGPTETTNMNLIHRAELVVGPGCDVLATARSLKGQLDESIAARHLPADSWNFPQRLDTTLDPHLSRIAITNPGVLPDLRPATGVVVTDYQVVAARRPSSGTFPEFQAYTYDGRLTINGIFPRAGFDASLAETVVDGYLGELDALCSTIDA